MPPISVLLKPASGMCNMHCDYCFYRDEQENRAQENYGFMSEETLKNCIRRTLLHAEGAASYAFQGGEPTLRGLDFFKKVIRYEKQYNRNRVRVQNALQTNGLLLDEEWCAFLKENGFLVGISLDGVQAVHDRYRHLKREEGSAFLRVMDRIMLLKRTGVDFNVLTVVTDDAADHIEEIYRFYQEEGFLWQQYIACLEPLTDARGFGLSPEKYGTFLIKLWDLWVRDTNRPYIRQFENWLGLLQGYLPEACDMRGTCGIQYVCEADGSVYPCDFYMTDEYRIGNFNTDRLDAADEKRREIGFREASEKLPEKCRSCTYLRLCRGGCRRNRMTPGEAAESGGEVYLNRFCESFRTFFTARYEEMKKEAESFR